MRLGTTPPCPASAQPKGMISSSACASCCSSAVRHHLPTPWQQLPAEPPEPGHRSPAWSCLPSLRRAVQPARLCERVPGLCKSHRVQPLKITSLYVSFLRCFFFFLARLMCRSPVKFSLCDSFLTRKSDIRVVKYGCGSKPVHIYSTPIRARRRPKHYSLQQVPFDTDFQISFV